MSSKTRPVRFDAIINPSPEYAQAIDQGTQLNNMAQQLMRMGRYEEAESLHRQAIEVKERGLGTDHITTALSYNAMGKTYIRLNRLDEAEMYLQKALAIREASPRPQDEIDAAVTRENMAVVYEMRGDLPRARQIRRVGSPNNMLCANEKVRVPPFYAYKSFQGSHPCDTVRTVPDQAQYLATVRWLQGRISVALAAACTHLDCAVYLLLWSGLPGTCLQCDSLALSTDFLCRRGTGSDTRSTARRAAPSRRSL